MTRKKRPTRTHAPPASKPAAQDHAPSSPSTVDPHNAAEAAAVAIPGDAVPHDLMPWLPPLRLRYSDPGIEAPHAWRVTPRFDFTMHGEACVAGVPLATERVLTLEPRMLQRLYGSRHVAITHVEAIEPPADESSDDESDGENDGTTHNEPDALAGASAGGDL